MARSTGGAGQASDPVEILVSAGEVGERPNARETAPNRGACSPRERDAPEDRGGDQSSSGYMTMSTGSA